MRSTAVTAMAAMALAVLASTALATPTYRITDLGSLGGYSYADGISDSGLVTGFSDTGLGHTAAFIWQDGVMAALPGALGAGTSYGYAVNDAAQVAGCTSNGSYLQSALWSDGSLEVLPGFAAMNSQANDINSSGVVAGTSRGTTGYRAYVWDGTLHDLGTLGGTASYANGINDAGQVVGMSYTSGINRNAFLWEDGVMTSLFGLGGTTSVGSAINNLGDVVGYSQTKAGAYCAVLWTMGKTVNLGASVPGGPSYAYDINDAGQVVGEAVFSDGEAFLWEDDVMYDLNTLIPAGSGWTLVTAAGINSSGWIVGYGLHDGQQRAFLLTPDSTVPAPGALTLGLLGLGGIGAARRARLRRR
jgi:probable HAF family extracellular repeat protein